MSRASIPTLLGIDRYARILGVNPVHFSGAAGTTLFPLGNACSDVWWQRSYMGADRVSREDLAFAISTAERDLAAWLGYWPAPVYISQEMHEFPRHYRRDVFDQGFNNRFLPKSLKLRWGKFISAGRRTQTLVGNASTGGGTMVWSDPDGDGFDELMTITLPSALASSTRPYIKVYQSGETAPEYEIRYPKSVNFVAGSLIIEFDFWQMLDPDAQDPYPDVNGASALNIATATNYIDSCDVYYEYCDFSQASATFYWEPRQVDYPCASCGGTGCPNCTLTEQNGCIHVRDVPTGIAVPSPATYDSTTGEWTQDEWSVCMAPDQVKVWYQAGDLSDRYLNGHDLDPLSDYWAEVIAWMATARLERNFCACGNLTALVQDLRMDTMRSDPNGPVWMLTDRMRDNPFGTRKGEIMAWRRVSQLADRVPKVAVI